MSAIISYRRGEVWYNIRSVASNALLMVGRLLRRTVKKAFMRYLMLCAVGGDRSGGGRGGGRGA